ncbi:MAG: hypothetical protein QOI20_3255 [Acidimicrobiaceae bacterium]|nr:hypothetical protein [Acidimicrobiaceae bacterium]
MTKRAEPLESGEVDLRLVEKNKRIERIEDLIAQQYSTKQIVAKVVDEFGVAERTAYTDITECYERAVPDSEEERSRRLDRARRSWQRRMRLAEEKGDQSAANYALDRLCKLDGLYAPKKVEMSSSVTVSVSMRSVVGVLDAAGLAALELVMQQVEAAKARGELPAAEPPELVPVESDAEHDG